MNMFSNEGLRRKRDVTKANTTGIECLLELPGNGTQTINIFEHSVAYEMKELFLSNDQNLEDFDVIICFSNGKIDVLNDEEELDADRLTTCEKVCIVAAGSVAQQGPNQLKI